MANKKQLKQQLNELEYQLKRIVDEELPVNRERVLEYRQLLQRENPKNEGAEAIQGRSIGQNEH